MRCALLVVPLLVAFLSVPAARSFAAAGWRRAAPPPRPARARGWVYHPLAGESATWMATAFRTRCGSGSFGTRRRIKARPNRVVGDTTASGANSVVQISSASPIPLAALAIDAHNDGGNQIIVSDGRGARLYTFAECQLQAVVDSQGTPFVFDLHLRGHGTRVGCSDLGRTETDLYGTLATIGQSDTVTAASVQDLAVVSARTITCGDLTISRDGVRQP